MSTSLYKLAEQTKSLVGERAEMQELIESVRQSFGSAVKLLWYENKKNELSEIDGAFVYTFGKDPAIVPELDTRTKQYFIPIPSTYISLPHEMGIVQVSYMESQDAPFARLANGAWGLFAGLKSSELGGVQPFYSEGMKIYFPKMKSTEVGEILLKLSIGLDGIDVRENLNIPLNIQDQIVNMVIQKFNPKPQGDTTLNNG